MWSACGSQEMVICVRETTIFKDTGQHIWDHLGMGWLYGFTNFGKSCSRARETIDIGLWSACGLEPMEPMKQPTEPMEQPMEPSPVICFLSLESKLTNKSAKPGNKSRPVNAKLIFV